jgi:mono/diheme cytochrome c family protein
LRKAGARDTAAQAEKRSAKPVRSSAGSADAGTIAEAIRLAVGPLQRTALESPAIFLRHASKQECISCHQQQLPLTAISLARQRHIPVDEAAVARQADAVERFFDIELDLQATFHPEPAIANGYGLLALHLEHRPVSAATDSAVHQLAVIQNRDGYWPWNLPRPPIQSSAIGATALAVQALKNYPIPGRLREFDERVQRARAWLAKAQPESNEERAYQLLGLGWAGDRPGKLKPLAEALIREQRPDGGWGQLPKLPSDAFATGQSLYALMQAGGIPTTHAAVKKGIRYLLETQLADGTWHIRRRAFPFQPPMESGFPHGADGWISSAGTSWAVMALAMAVDPSKVPAGHDLMGKTTDTSGTKPVVAGSTTTPVEFARDIQPLLERSCVVCHSGERAKGGFQMVNRALLLQGGKRGEPVIVAGQSTKSPLLQFVSDQVEDLEMPPLGRREKFPPLTREEIARLSAWVDQGAVWPDDVKLHVPKP